MEPTTMHTTKPSPDPATIKVGEELPVFEREVGFANWNRYAAVNDEFVPIHMDDEAGQAAGYPTAFGMGHIHIAYLHVMLRGWLAGSGTVRGLDVQFRQPSTRGILNRVTGVVTSIGAEGSNRIIEIKVCVQDGDGTALTPGTATVVVPSRADVLA